MDWTEYTEKLQRAAAASRNREAGIDRELMELSLEIGAIKDALESLGVSSRFLEEAFDRRLSATGDLGARTGVVPRARLRGESPVEPSE